MGDNIHGIDVEIEGTGRAAATSRIAGMRHIKDVSDHVASLALRNALAEVRADALEDEFVVLRWMAADRQPA